MGHHALHFTVAVRNRDNASDNDPFYAWFSNMAFSKQVKVQVMEWDRDVSQRGA